MLKKENFNINLNSEKKKSSKKKGSFKDIESPDLFAFSREMKKTKELLKEVTDENIENVKEKVLDHFKLNKIEYNIPNLKTYIAGAELQLTTTLFTEFLYDKKNTHETAERTGLPMIVHGILRKMLDDLIDDQ